MANGVGREAVKPNRALEDWRVLVGEWRTVGTHPMVPGVTFHGRAVFDWIEGGAFLMMHSEIDEPQIPSGVAIFGSDDARQEFYMLYFDERGVSRKYEASLGDGVVRWWRNDPKFSQRFTATIVDGGNTMIGKGEMSRDGAKWEEDLELTYTRSG